MLLRAPGVGALMIGAPRPIDGMGERPPSTTPAAFGAERGAGSDAGTGAGCRDGCGADAGCVSGADWPRLSVRFPNT
jgi:hypothetical protein